MAGSCYVSLGLWPGIQVGGERHNAWGSQAWRRSVRESEGLGAGTGRGQALHRSSPFPCAPCFLKGTWLSAQAPGPVGRALLLTPL